VRWFLPLCVLLTLAAVTPVEAIPGPACWSIAPHPSPPPDVWNSGIYTWTDGCQGFALIGSDPWGAIRLESTHSWNTWMLVAAPPV
jgi:hypothetical protein